MFKSISLNILVTIIEVLSNFTLKILIARSLSKAEFASFGTALDICSMLLIASFCFKDAYIYNFNKLKNLNKKYLKLKLTYLLLCILIAPLFLRSIDSIKSFYALLPPLFFLISTVTYNYIIHSALAIRDYNFVSYSMMIKSITTPILIIGLILNDYLNFSGIFISYSIGNLIIILTSSYLLKKIALLSSNAKNQSSLKVFYKNSIMSFLEHMSYTSSLYISTFLLNSFFTHKDTANFLAINRPIYLALISITSYPIFRLAYPELNSLYKRDDITKILNLNRNFKFIVILFILSLSLFSIFFLKNFIIFAFGEKYSNSFSSTLTLLLSTPFVLYTTFLNAHLKATGNFRSVLLIRIKSCLIYILSLIILIITTKKPESIIWSINIQMLTAFLLTLKDVEMNKESIKI